GPDPRSVRRGRDGRRPPRRSARRVCRRPLLRPRARLPRRRRPPGHALTASFSSPFAAGKLELRNRLVATAHATGLVRDGLPVDGDAEYWRRLADGGAAMAIPGGTVV